jgi:Ca-activated chloride channel family protein
MTKPSHCGAALAFALALLVGVAAAQVPKRPTPPAPKREPAEIRVEVNLVTVLASVLDASGRPVADLPREAFEIYEEGVRQKIAVFEAETSQPLDLVLMIDTSISTRVELPFQMEAAAHFIRQVVRPGDRVAVYEFSEDVTQLTGFSADVPLLQGAVRGVEPGAGTSLYDAVFLGAQALEKRPRARRRVLVLVTDAGETTSRAKFEDARRAAISSEAMLYTILVRVVKNEGGRNTAGEHALLNITDATGGAMYPVDSPSELEPTFDRIDRELRTQYRLGYYAEPLSPAQSFRRIEVRVVTPAKSKEETAPGQPAGGYMVRYRKGYFTAGAL